MMDPFGNYLCQKLFDVITPEQVANCINTVLPYVINASLNAHGTRAVQKLIEVVPNQTDLQKLIQILKPHISTLAKDLNGNHVLQRCLNTWPAQNNQFIYDTAKTQLLDIATHRHGCCVLQRCLDAGSQTQRQMLVDLIVNSAVQLVQDAFGNYVVQYVLDQQDLEVNGRLAEIFMGKILELSKQKFSSNVIEKCLMQCPAPIQNKLMNEIAKTEHIGPMLMDQYANYVLQRVMTIAPPYLLQRILRDCRPHLEVLKKTQTGKRVHSKLVNKFPELLQN